MDRRITNSIGGKTARACYSCLRRRARWYCTADDAFLCQGCDASVHSANQLASRHERVRLGESNPKENGSAVDKISAPAWHQGFTRKARTTRYTKPFSLQLSKKDEEKFSNPLPLVPEIGSEEASPDENEDQLLYRVPVFDPFDTELCEAAMEDGSRVLLMEDGHDGMDHEDFINFPGFLPSDMELAEFAADVESLLRDEIEEKTPETNELGRLNCKEKEGEKGRVKVEEEEEDEEIEAVLACQIDPMVNLMRETVEWNFDYDLPMVGEEGEEDQKVVAAAVSAAEIMKMDSESSKAEMKKEILLKLNYDGVITAWANKGCPWTTGIRPDFSLHDCWPDFMGATSDHKKHGNFEGWGGGHGGSNGDGEREARVSRYREKRRTRLFSKKIRYEVRKLNAEKRPRMKGRFVKRTSFTGPSFPNYLN